MHISSNFRMLVVEDDEPKLRAIINLLAELNIDSVNISIATSVASALDCISFSRVDFAIIDMSLPAFDFARDISGGGQPQGTGGRDILRFLEDECPDAKAIVLTQYQEFDLGRSFTEPQKLDDFIRHLKFDFPSILLEVVFYSGQRGEWKTVLKDVIASLEGN